jgi:hypothetical protein
LLTEAFARCDGEKLAILLRAQQVALVSTVLDFAADALPILLERIVALDDRLQLEALGGVADLLAPQHVDAAIHVFARDGGLDLFDAHEVLLVQRAQAFEPALQLLQRDVELRLLHLVLSSVKALRPGGRNKQGFPSC